MLHHWISQTKLAYDFNIKNSASDEQNLLSLALALSVIILEKRTGKLLVKYLALGSTAHDGWRQPDNLNCQTQRSCAGLTLFRML